MITQANAYVNSFPYDYNLGYTARMTKYAAMIRGIGPGNPNMRGDMLKSAFDSLGFSDVHPVITSGNVVFKSDITDTEKLESMVEGVFPGLLGFSRTVFIRSQAELQALVDTDPFSGIEQGPKHYITLTFLKNQPEIIPKLPYKPANEGYEILAVYDRVVAATLDQTQGKTPRMMAWLEREFGKDITTRTWKTVNRLLNVLEKL